MTEYTLPVASNYYKLPPEPRTPAETRAALEGSIAKWQSIVDGTGKDFGAENCPLCQLFYYQVDQCNGCPVAAKTGKVLCMGSSYAEEWKDSRKKYYGTRAEYKARRIAAAQNELDFPKGLL